MDIRNFLTKYPNRVLLREKILFSSTCVTGKICPPKTFDALVRDDLVRKECDRSKKKKKRKVD